MIKRLLILILLGGAFFLGYHVGRLPGAPDLTPYAKKCYDQAVVVYRCALQWVQSELEKQSAARAEQAKVAAADQTTGAEQENYGP